MEPARVLYFFCEFALFTNYYAEKFSKMYGIEENHENRKIVLECDFE